MMDIVFKMREVLARFDGLEMVGGSSVKQCSADSYALLYAIIGMAIVIAVSGFLVWRRFIRTRPCNSGIGCVCETPLPASPV